MNSAGDAGWTWTALRPDAVSGFAVGNPMNLLMAIGVYAAMCREFGVPFRFPGKPGAYRALTQVTDARLLARAIVWSATNPDCAGEVFNITGDIFRWQNLWPRLADFFGLECGEPQPMSLTEFMSDKAPVWDRIVERQGLHRYSFEQIAAWEFGDAVFAMDYDNVFSTTKARRHGFADCVDSEEMFVELFTELQRRRILPTGR